MSDAGAVVIKKRECHADASLPLSCAHGASMQSLSFGVAVARCEGVVARGIG